MSECQYSIFHYIEILDQRYEVSYSTKTYTIFKENRMIFCNTNIFSECYTIYRMIVKYVSLFL